MKNWIDYLIFAGFALLIIALGLTLEARPLDYTFYLGTTILGGIGTFFCMWKILKESV